MKKTFFYPLSLLAVFQINAQNRSEFLLEKNWKFSRTEDANFMTSTFDDSQWQTVTVPHDWAIYGPFSPKNDMQNVAIIQDGQTEATEHAGRTGGLPFVGVGLYRKQFEIPQYSKGKKVTLVFDGAMANSKIYMNGQYVGEWPYGYNSFHFDVTDFVVEREKKHTCCSFDESSRAIKMVSRSRLVSECFCSGDR